MDHDARLTAAFTVLLAIVALAVIVFVRTARRRSAISEPTAGQRVYNSVRIIVSAGRPADLMNAPATSRRNKGDYRGTWVSVKALFDHEGHRVLDIAGNSSHKRTDQYPVLAIYNATLGTWLIAFYDGEDERSLPALGTITADFVVVSVVGYFAPNEAD